MRPWIDRAACFVIAVPLTAVHCAAFAVWSRLNRWPQYNDPESWSSPPLVDHQLFYQMGLLSLMFAMISSPVCAVLAALSTRRKLGHLSGEDRSVLIPVMTLVLVALLWADPSGAVNWFAD